MRHSHLHICAMRAGERKAYKAMLRKVRTMPTECSSRDCDCKAMGAARGYLIKWLLDCDRRAKRKGGKGKPLMNGPYPERGGPVW